MRPTIILWLIFLSIAIRLNFVYHPKAAILHQRDPNPILDQDQEPIKEKEEELVTGYNRMLGVQHDNQQTPSTRDEDSRQNFYVKQSDENTKREFDLLESKFILLASGDQMKLYPIKLVIEGRQTLITTDSIDNNNYFIIKPIKLNVTDPKILEYSPDNSYKRWLISDSKRKLNPTESKTSGKNISKASILPGDTDETEESYENNISGWGKPVIVDVDYFVDKNYCYNPTEFCLVVAWLDKSNKLIRYGSIDLMEALKPFESTEGLSRTNAKESVLWLDEFPPIQVYKTISEHGVCKEQCNFDKLELFSMVIDKRRGVLHVAFSNGIDPAIKPNKILTGFFKTRFNLSDHPRHTQLMSQRVLSFNKYPAANIFDENIGLQNLNVDEEIADWLFYFDSSQGGKIFALGIDDQWSDKRGLAADKEAIQSLAYHNNSILTDAKIQGASNFAFDQQNRRMLLINYVNELYSCGISGEGMELVGTLSQKPTIRSSYSMQIFGNTLLISDPIKKSLIGVNLDQYNRRLKNLGQQKDKSGFGMTHQVLIIQMNSLYGFRVVDRELTMTDDIRGSTRKANLNLINRIAENIDNPSKVIDSLIPKFFAGYSSAYDNLICRSSLFYPESLDRWRQYVEKENLKLKLGTLGLVICYLSLIILLICIYFIRKRRNIAKQDDLYKLQLDSDTQSNDPK